MSVTAQTIIDLALADIGAKAIGEATPPAESADGLVRLNQLVDSLATQPLTMPFIARLTFALTAGKGTEINPYTIGPGGNFDTARPTRLEGAGLILGGLPENENTVAPARRHGPIQSATADWQPVLRQRPRAEHPART